MLHPPIVSYRQLRLDQNILYEDLARRMRPVDRRDQLTDFSIVNNRMIYLFSFENQTILVWRDAVLVFNL